MSDIRLVTELTFNRFLDMFWHEDEPHYRPFSYDGLDVIWNDLQEFANATVVDGDTYTVDYGSVKEMYDEYDNLADYANSNNMTEVVYLANGDGSAEQLLDDLEAHKVYKRNAGTDTYACVGTGDLRWKFLSSLALEPADRPYVQNAISDGLFTESHYKQSRNALELFVHAWLHACQGSDVMPTFEEVAKDYSKLDALSDLADEAFCDGFVGFVDVNTSSLFSCVVDGSFANAIDDLCFGEIDGDFTESYRKWLLNSVEKDYKTVVSGSDGHGVFVLRN